MAGQADISALSGQGAKRRDLFLIARRFGCDRMRVFGHGSIGRGENAAHTFHLVKHVAVEPLLTGQVMHVIVKIVNAFTYLGDRFCRALKYIVHLSEALESGGDFLGMRDAERRNKSG